MWMYLIIFILFLAFAAAVFCCIIECSGKWAEGVQTNDEITQAKRHKYAVAYYTFENGKQETHTFTLANESHRRVLLADCVAVATGTSDIQRLTIDFHD